MLPVLSRLQSRALDQQASQRGVPGLLLMENAGRGAAERILQLGGEGPYSVVCGPGNNGGDGLVVARHLLAAGCAVRVGLFGPRARLRGDALVNLQAWEGLGGSLALLDDPSPRQALESLVEGAAWVVDALFGTGLDRPLEGLSAQVVQALSACGRPIVSLDLPSGLDADRGVPLGCAVHATHTLTFGVWKPGLLTPRGADLAGVTELIGLGIPLEPLVRQVGQMGQVLELEEARPSLRRRPASTHKYTAGNVLVLAGSAGKTGAARLAAQAALRAGAGIVTLGTWSEVVSALEGQVPELMVAPLDRASPEASVEALLLRRQVVAVGPGFGLDDGARRVLDLLLRGWAGVKVLDADALTLVGGRAELLRDAPGVHILTPHAGELGKLLERSSAEIESDRYGAVLEAARRTGAVVVLKGAYSLVAAPSGELWVGPRGAPVLATAGSGDVLCGMLAALACVERPERAACLAVDLHARLGQDLAGRLGTDRGVLAGDLVAELPRVVGTLLVPDTRSTP